MNRSRLTPHLQAAIRNALGVADRETSILVPDQRGEVSPVLNDEIAVQKFVEQDCGADAWTIQQGKLVALRDNGDGTTRVLKRYEIDVFGRA